MAYVVKASEQLMTMSTPESAVPFVCMVKIAVIMQGLSIITVLKYTPNFYKTAYFVVSLGGEPCAFILRGRRVGSTALLRVG